MALRDDIRQVLELGEAPEGYTIHGIEEDGAVIISYPIHELPYDTKTTSKWLESDAPWVSHPSPRVRGCAEILQDAGFTVVPVEEPTQFTLRVTAPD